MSLHHSDDVLFGSLSNPGQTLVSKATSLVLLGLSSQGPPHLDFFFFPSLLSFSQRYQDGLPARDEGDLKNPQRPQGQEDMVQPADLLSTSQLLGYHHLQSLQLFCPRVRRWQIMLLLSYFLPSLFHDRPPSSLLPSPHRYEKQCRV